MVSLPKSQTIERTGETPGNPPKSDHMGGRAPEPGGKTPPILPPRKTHPKKDRRTSGDRPKNGLQPKPGVGMVKKSFCLAQAESHGLGEKKRYLGTRGVDRYLKQTVKILGRGPKTILDAM